MMLGALVWILLIVIGYQAPRLRWQQFAVMAVLSGAGVLFQTLIASSNRNEIGLDGAALWEPLALLGNWLVNCAMWAVVFLIGHGVGRWQRRRRERRDK